MPDVSENAASWEPELYAGSAHYYPRGRAAYPPAVAERLAETLGLDGSGRLLDVGCGPGSLTLLLAGLFAEAVGVDADAGMLDEAERQASAAGVGNVWWRRLRAEELPAGLGMFRMVSFAQSFHWMDRDRVAAAAHGMLEPGGVCVHVGATTHRGVDGDAVLPHPAPPHREIDALVRRYLGAPRPGGVSGEDEIYRAAGFDGPEEIVIPGRVLTRDEDTVVAAVFSLSSATPHLFGERRGAFETDLRALLRATSPDGVFSEEMREISLRVWRP